VQAAGSLRRCVFCVLVLRHKKYAPDLPAREKYKFV
jgi:hypothetical protein